MEYNGYVSVDTIIMFFLYFTLSVAFNDSVLMYVFQIPLGLATSASIKVGQKLGGQNSHQASIVAKSALCCTGE